jgi:DNA-binding IclR family transcriptional regulator
MAEPHLGPTAQKVLTYLQQNRGTAFAAGDVCEAVDCSTSEAQSTLETLAQEGLVEREQSGAGVTLYTAR